MLSQTRETFPSTCTTLCLGRWSSKSLSFLQTYRHPFNCGSGMLLLRAFHLEAHLFAILIEGIFRLCVGDFRLTIAN